MVQPGGEWRRTRAAMAALLVLPAPGPGRLGQEAAPSLEAKVEAWLAPMVSAHELSGVVRIAKGGRVLVERAWGRAIWAGDEPLAPDARFCIASITKPFTAAGIALLAERGELFLDDPLSRHVAGFPRGDEISLRHLLLHSSGVGNPESPPSSDATLDVLVGELAKQPLAFAPGARSRYSNGGYALLARVIVRVSEQSYESFLDAEIFGPLALRDTAVDRRSPPLERRVRGHVPGPGAPGLVEAPDQGAWAAFGSGCLVSTAADLHRFGRALRDNELFDRAKLEHPYGWGVRTRAGRDTIEQSGILNGFASYLAVYLADDLHVVVLSNVQTGSLETLGIGLGTIALGGTPAPLVPFPAEVALEPERRRAWLGHYANPAIGSCEITEEGGALRLRWGDARSTCHVAPSGPTTAADRQDSIAMTLEATASGASSLRMRWLDGTEHVFTRTR